MKDHFDLTTASLLTDAKKSSLINHGPEQGKNNESLFGKFLQDHLPTRFKVSTGIIFESA
jgi:hypothetical protein